MSDEQIRDLSNTHIGYSPETGQFEAASIPLYPPQGEDEEPTPELMLALAALESECKTTGDVFSLTFGEEMYDPRNSWAVKLWHTNSGGAKVKSLIAGPCLLSCILTVLGQIQRRKDKET